MVPEILEADLMMIMIDLKNLKDHPEDLNLKKMNLKKTIRRGDLVGGMFQELYPLLQQVEVGHLQGREISQFENDEPIRRRRQTSEDRNRKQPETNNFGERRNLSRDEVKTGSRPRMNRRVSRQDNISPPADSSPLRKKPTRSPIREQTSTAQVEDASFKDANQAKKPRETRRVSSSARSSSKNQNSRYNVGTNKKKPRDNSSRFDD